MSKPQRASLYKRAMAAILTCTLVWTLVPTYALAEESSVDSVAVAQEQSSTSTTNDASEQSVVSEDEIASSEEQQANDAEQTVVENENAVSSAVEESIEDDANTSNVSSSDSVENTTKQTVEEVALEVEAEKDAEDLVATEAATSPVSVTYRAHVQRKGWMSWVKDGAVGGTSGKSLRVEALNIKLNMGSSGLTGGIRYRMHVQNQGWSNWAQDGALGGTYGKSLRLEALQIELYGDVADAYDVYYSVHAQNMGWMAWAKNGACAGTAGKSLRLEAVKIVLVPKGEDAPKSDFVTHNRAYEGGDVLNVQAHVQGIGWMNTVGNGATAGTTGRSLRLEALRLNVNGLGVPGSVMISGHVQNIGWTSFNNGFAGTVGQSKRLEAVKIKLSGSEIEDDYDIYYRVHVSNIGWLNWACNGEPAGTQAMGARIEAIQTKLVKKGESFNMPSSATSEAFITGTNVTYKAHCQDYGWRGVVRNGGTAGTTGKGKRLEAFTAELDGGTVGGGIKYCAYVGGSGWQSFTSDGSVAGTVGKSKAVEAIKVRLTGRAAKVYDVYYRVHIQDAGWLGWARSGQEAGAPGVGRRIEAIQIRLVSKLDGAPGSTENHVVNKAFFDDEMTKAAQGYSSPTEWLIMVNDEETKLGVYHGSQGNWTKHASWRVSTGSPTSPSLHGVFSVGDRGYAFGYGHGYTCYYWVSWCGAYLFHSIKYNEGTFDVQDGTIGGHVSGGCIRMPIDKAKWIYDTIPYGTTVVVY